MSELDVEAVARAVAGDAAAREGLWRRYRRAVAAVLLAHASRRTELEDLVQETALAFCRSIESLREPQRFEPWLMQIARNIGRGDRRREKVRPPQSALEVSEIPSLPAPESAFRGDELAGAVSRLPIEYREPLLLKCIEGLSQRRVAELLGLPETTIETRLVRARRLLREQLDPPVARSAPSESHSRGSP